MEPKVGPLPPVLPHGLPAGPIRKQAERHIHPVGPAEGFHGGGVRALVGAGLMVPVYHQAYLLSPFQLAGTVQMVGGLGHGRGQVVNGMPRPDTYVVEYGGHGILVNIGRIGVQQKAVLEHTVHMVPVFAIILAQQRFERLQQRLDGMVGVLHKRKQPDQYGFIGWPQIFNTPHDGGGFNSQENE